MQTFVKLTLALIIFNLNTGLLLHLQAQAIDPTPIIRDIDVKDGIATLSVGFQTPFAWEKITFHSRKTYPNMWPEFPPTRHSLTFGHFEKGLAEWFQYDFIEMGRYETEDTYTVNVSFTGRPAKKGVFDPDKRILLFDGEIYDPVIRTPKYVIQVSETLQAWSDVPDSMQETSSRHPWSSDASVQVETGALDTLFFRLQLVKN
ncbi:MAG: hypothetical protein P8L18_15970 [Verrucomicrobiota bacterium]|nr:hypothetical protein [Verrucomicrobiota bacterium]